MNNEFPVIPAERADDLHGLEVAEQADLVLFMAGNQFMVMAELIAAFRKACPEVEKIFYETLPPGLELRQILAGGALFKGQRLTVVADVYSSVHEQAMKTLIEKQLIEPDGYFAYLHNRLTLMVPAGNPAGICSVADLGRPEVRISQPDPRQEDIGHHIMAMYRQAGGEPLVRRIMEGKLAAGTTLLTKVHHRETPERIKAGTVDVGPVWATEAVHARRSGLDFGVVEPGLSLDQRDRINYYLCKLKNGNNPGNGRKFLDFIRSDPAREIYGRYGFVVPDADRR